MKKAVIIIAHKNSYQLNVFIKQLLSINETDIFIHINKKFNKISNEIIKNERVHIIKNNIEVSWGSDTVLKAILLCMKEIIELENFEYIIVATGQDLLIKKGLDEFLEMNKQKVFVEVRNDNLDVAYRISRSRLMYKWPKIFFHRYDFKLNPIKMLRKIYSDLTRKGVPLFKKKMMYNHDNLRFYLDYFWIGLPIDVAKYIYEESKKDSIKELYFNSHIPEEEFFSTLIMNSIFSDRITFENNKSCSLCYVKKFINNHPPIFTISDIDELEKSGYYFARKFDSNLDKKVIEYFYKKIIGDI